MAFARIGLTLFWFIVAIAILSRLLTSREIPELIRNGATALQRLFNGAFGF